LHTSGKKPKCIVAVEKGNKFFVFIYYISKEGQNGVCLSDYAMKDIHYLLRDCYEKFRGNFPQSVDLISSNTFVYNRPEDLDQVMYYVYLLDQILNILRNYNDIDQQQETIDATINLTTNRQLLISFDKIKTNMLR
jgi:hypothetical protein